MGSAKELKPIGSTDMGSDFLSSNIELLYLDKGSAQIVWSGATATDGKIIAEISCEPKALNFLPLPKGEVLISAASGTALIQMPDICYRWLRFRYEAGSNTAGSISVYCVIK